MIWTRNAIFNKKKIFDNNIEIAWLKLKNVQTAQNMSFDQLIELFQKLNDMKTTK